MAFVDGFTLAGRPEEELDEFDRLKSKILTRLN